MSATPGRPVDPLKLPAFPTLNWKEIERLISHFREVLFRAGAASSIHVDRIVVPDRSRYPGGYIKGEWVIRMASRKQEHWILFSIRARYPYICLNDGKGPKASPAGTRSPFDLALSKHLKGARLLDLQAIPKERTIVLWFTVEGRVETEERLGLVLTLIPALPEALLVRREMKAEATLGWQILARSRTLRQTEPAPTHYFPPDGAKAPLDLPLRESLVESTDAYSRIIEDCVAREGFDLRLKEAQRDLKDLVKQAQDRTRQAEVAIRESSAEPDWQRYGTLLKGSLLDPPPITTEETAKGAKTVRRAFDFENQEYVAIPCDPKLNPQAQVEKFFNFSRRKIRRVEEAESRLSTLRETLARIHKIVENPPLPTATPLDWNSLERFERASGAILPAPGTAATTAKRPKGKAGAWLGKTFLSKEGLNIWVGRSRDENLELTFKHARGNDIWMHVRGRPGAHVVIPLHSGKSASLDTLLDAAVLTVYYSDGEKWGKTEVDYAFKKHVKRIKDSKEASYTNNKTLIVEADQARLKRLLDSVK